MNSRRQQASRARGAGDGALSQVEQDKLEDDIASIDIRDGNTAVLVNDDP